MAITAVDTRHKILSSLLFILYLVFITSFIVSFRAVTSISVALIFLCGVIQNRAGFRPLFADKTKRFFVIACGLFFGLQVVALLYTHHRQEGWDNLRLKSGLLVIPLAFSLIKPDLNLRKRLFAGYCMILAAASGYCFLLAGWHYLGTGDLSLFFYHALVSPFSQHAVYFSIFVFTALVLLLENRRNPFFYFHPFFAFGLIAWFSVFLFLLSSKLVIIFYLLYLFYHFIAWLKRPTTNRVLAMALFVLVMVISSLVLILHNPVSKRFDEIWNGDMKMVEQEKFDKGDYLNGLQFRLLQWKFVPEILTKTGSWWTGVSPGNAQSRLDDEYIAKNLYTGDPVRKTKGYLGYNAHNQFLESLLQTGIPGLLVFGLICFALVRMAVQAKNQCGWLVILLLLTYSLIESVFETQYGILLFTFFPLFICDRSTTHTNRG